MSKPGMCFLKIPFKNAALRIWLNIIRCYPPGPMMKQRELKSMGLVVVALGVSACNGASGVAPDMSSQAISQSTSQATPPKTTVKMLNYTFGPYRLPAGTSVKSVTSKEGSLSFHVDAPVWMTGFEPRLVDGKGKALPGQLVQIVILSNGREANSLCIQRQTPNPFAATTSLLKKTSLPEGFGYPLLPEDPLEAKIVLRNPTNEDFNDVYFSFTLTAEPMDVANHKKDVSTLLLDVDPCDHSGITLPPNGLVEKKESFVAPESGKLVKAAGLLQNYGVSVTIEAREEEDRFSWSTQSQLDENHHIVALEDFNSEQGAPIRKDDPIHLGVVYDNFSNRWVNDATAAAMMYIARDENTTPAQQRPSSDGGHTGNQPAITATKAFVILSGAKNLD